VPQFRESRPNDRPAKRDEEQQPNRREGQGREKGAREQER
jgi:hypothetical protein